MSAARKSPPARLGPPRIAVTCGEPAGIGPDICLALAWHADSAQPVILGDRDLLAARARQLGLSVTLRDFDAALPRTDGTLDVLHIPLAVPAMPGQLDARNSRYVLALLDAAIQGCETGRFAAMVTAPIHKGIICEAAIAGQENFSGHTEYLAQKTRTHHVVMMLAGKTPNAHLDGTLRVALATTHLPLSAVPAVITRQSLTATLRVLNEAMRRRHGIASPRILVGGLNPHAGEGGHMGREEIEVIEPTLDALRQEGMQLIGPLPADTLYTPPILAQGDVTLAMYHDQGLAVLKHAAFGHAVNITLGLPLIRVSVDHGTALDLAGTGRASPESLFSALRVAQRMVEVGF
jgi:4-hydroxythreonine-4-phosphate dehydrogenase